MSPLPGVTLAGLAKKYPKNGGVRKANYAFEYLGKFVGHIYIYMVPAKARQYKLLTCMVVPNCNIHVPRVYVSTRIIAPRKHNVNTRLKVFLIRSIYFLDSTFK